MPLRFHWMLPKGGEIAIKEVHATARALTTAKTSPTALPDISGWTRFARAAEEAGIESVLTSFSRCEPDSLHIATAMGLQTPKLKYISAYRSGLMQPTTFVQHVNTVSAMTNGRIALNIVAGDSAWEQRGYGDFLDHDERYARAEEFLAICHAFWRGDDKVDFEGKYYRVEGGSLNTPWVSPDRPHPEIYIAGHSEQAKHLARAQGTAWLRLAEAPEKIRGLVAETREHDTELCLRLCVVCRPTREEALEAAEALKPDESIGNQERAIVAKTDSKSVKEALANAGDDAWHTPYLWGGLVPYYGAPSIALVGSPQDIANGFLEYGEIGVTQFIIAGFPKLEEMVTFGRDVLPLIRQGEVTLAEKIPA